MRELNLNEIEAVNGGLTYTVVVVKQAPQSNSSDSQYFDSGYGGGTVSWNTVINAS